MNGPNATARTVWNDVRWHIATGYETPVTGDSAPDWFNLANNRQAELAKRNPVREVYRVRLSCGVFFAKVFTHASLAATLKEALEFNRQEALEAAASDYTEEPLTI